ncbi:MAG TPA: SRPBCC family protein [Solirubrobacteraceae bacterium]|nr:SRPBCC family protein [Solirubrobacteraceae bacterium]
MSAVTTSIEIAAPPERVWEVVMDTARLGDWVTIHRRLGEHDDPLGENARIVQTINLRGVSLRVRWTVREWDPPRRAVWEGRGPARSRALTEYKLSARNGGTLFSYHNDFRAPMGPLGAAASRALVGGTPEREAKASLQRLKALLES